MCHLTFLCLDCGGHTKEIVGRWRRRKSRQHKRKNNPLPIIWEMIVLNIWLRGTDYRVEQKEEEWVSALFRASCLSATVHSLSSVHRIHCLPNCLSFIERRIHQPRTVTVFVVWWLCWGSCWWWSWAKPQVRLLLRLAHCTSTLLLYGNDDGSIDGWKEENLE